MGKPTGKRVEQDSDYDGAWLEPIRLQRRAHPPRVARFVEEFLPF